LTWVKVWSDVEKDEEGLMLANALGQRMAWLMKMETITGRTGPTPNRVFWKPLEGQLPMKHVVAGNRLGGAVALAVGLPISPRRMRPLLDPLRHTVPSAGAGERETQHKKAITITRTSTNNRKYT
jgi:hypothetical protein